MVDVKIIRHGNICKIEDSDVKTMKQLDKLLSFKIPGAEYSKAFKGYTNAADQFVSWDGIKHILSPKGYFPAGLFECVMDFYDQQAIYVEVEDQREPKTDKKYSFDIIPKLISIGKTPRPYQLEAAEKAIAKDMGIIRLPTGAGKTVVAGLIAAALGKSTIVYVIGTDLLYQLQRFFTEIFEMEIGIIGDGKCEIRDINIATVWSVAKVLGEKKSPILDDEGSDGKEKNIEPSKFEKIKEMLLRTKVNIFDECHSCSASSFQLIYKHTKPEHIYGMSASPWRDDNSDLLIEAVLGKKIVDISAKTLIKQGYLVNPDIRFLAPDPYPYKSGKYPHIYSKYIIENEQRNGIILKAATKLIEQGFKPLILFQAIKHGNILNELLSKKLPLGLLSGVDSSKERDRVRGQLDKGEIKGIMASKIFDIGVDIPELSALVNCGGGKSSVRALQRVGRVIRLCEGKDSAAVFDFADSAPYLRDHAEVRKRIYAEEFNISWPKKI